MKRSVKRVILLTAALGMGGLIAFFDSRPTWDDTGVTAAALFVSSAVFGFVGPRRPWLWALAVGGWIPAIGILRARDPATALALLVAFAGAYGGRVARVMRSPTLPPSRGE